MSHPRKTSAVQDFPFLHPQVTWVVVTQEGEVLNPLSPSQRLNGASMVHQGRARLFIAWPGKTRSDLFEVDQPDKVQEIITLLSHSPHPVG